MINLYIPGQLNLFGNIKIKFNYYSVLGNASHELFRITFNSAFIGTNNKLKACRTEVGPECVQKDYEKFGENF